MPRDGSGTYTLPVNSFSPAVNNTVIDPSDWNDTADDLATAITDSLDRSGEGGMLANLDMGTHNVTNAGTYNKVTITAPATGSTLTIADGKTLTVSHTATFTGGDGYTVSIAAGKTVTVSNTITFTAGADGQSFAFPASSDTVAGIAAAQALTNKTIVGSSNTLSAIALSSLASQAAYTFTGNVTGSSASPTAFTIAGLTHKASPTGADLLIISDEAASHATKYCTITEAIAGTVAGVSSIAGNTGAFTLSRGITNSTNDIRLAQYYFSGYRSTNQTVTTATPTKIQFDTEDFDPQNWFDNVTNFRFLPNVAGKYRVTVTLLSNGTTTASAEAFIYKNGSSYGRAISPSPGSAISATITMIVDLNGSTDYVEGWGQTTATGTAVFSGGSAPQFTFMSINYVGP